jgi:hypothetical protein
MKTERLLPCSLATCLYPGLFYISILILSSNLRYRNKLKQTISDAGHQSSVDTMTMHVMLVVM